jgi:ClpP class serine protease
MFDSSDLNYKTLGALASAAAIGVGLGYYFGTRKGRVDKRTPKNTFYLFDTKESAWNSLFMPSTDHLEELYNELTKVPDNETINIVVKTHGGSLLWCNKITLLFKQREGKVRVFVKDYAHSAGSMLALASDEIYMNRYATMSAIDPQIDTFGFISYLPLKNLSSMIKDGQGLATYLSDNSEFHKNDTRKMINTQYNVDKIMEVMYDGVKDHATLFDRNAVEALGVRIFEWDGEDLPEDE